MRRGQGVHADQHKKLSVFTPHVDLGVDFVQKFLYERGHRATDSDLWRPASDTIPGAPASLFFNAHTDRACYAPYAIPDCLWDHAVATTRQWLAGPAAALFLPVAAPIPLAEYCARVGIRAEMCSPPFQPNPRIENWFVLTVVPIKMDAHVADNSVLAAVVLFVDDQNRVKLPSLVFINSCGCYASAQK